MEHWNLTQLQAPNGTQDAIVLRQDDNGRAILIVLNPGQEMGDHQVKENAWVTVVEGTVQMRADGESVEVGPGTLVRFDPNERHSIASAGGARILLFLAQFPGPGHYRGHERA